MRDHVKRYRLLLLALAGVLLLGVGSGFLVWRHGQQSSVKPSGTAQHPSTADARPPDAVEQAYARGDYRAAAAILEKAPPTDYKSRRALALAYVNAKEYDKAMAIYAELDKAGQLSAGFTCAAARLAKRTGDMATSDKYHALAIQRYKDERGSGARLYIERCEAGLREAGS